MIASTWLNPAEPGPGRFRVVRMASSVLYLPGAPLPLLCALLYSPGAS